MIEALFPSVFVAVLAGLLSIARFENQRWLRAHQRGVRGTSEIVAFLVPLTGFIGLIFGLAFLVSFGLQHGWLAGLGLVIITLVAPFIYVFLSRDNWIIWMIATLAIWPLMIALAFHTNWFGLVH